MKIRPILAAALLLGSMAGAYAAVPASVQSSIAMHGIQAVSDTPDAVRVVLKSEQVSLARYKSVVALSMCDPYWRRRTDMVDFNPKRIEVVNTSQKQGYALANSFRATCEILGMPAPGKYLDKHTEVCVDGACRARKEGEHLASDE